MTELRRELADQLIKDCEVYPYHELVAYANGVTIGELRDWLERGAVVGEKERDPEKKELRRFTREYCRTDAAFAARQFKRLSMSDEASQRTQDAKAAWKHSAALGQLWAWFERRWPCGSPLAIGNLLSGERVEQLSLIDALENPNAEIQGALTAARYFRAEDLEDPPEWLSAALGAAGWERDAEPDEGIPSEG